MAKTSLQTVKHCPDVVDYITEPLRALAPLGRRELMAAKRQGRDLDELNADYWRRYEEAWLEMERRADETAERLGVAPIVIWQQVMESDTMVEVLERKAPPSRWGAMIPRALENGARVTVPSPPTRPARVSVKRRARAARTSTPSRGDPDDPDPERPRLIGDILADVLEELLRRTGPERAHDALVARRVGREVFGR
jgi:hypothetical protein